MSPTTSSAALSGTAFNRACISKTSTIEVSSTTKRSQSSGLSLLRVKPPALRSTSRVRWIVLGSNLVASVMRFAARPVGAQSSRVTPFADRMRRIELTMEVFPTPGPPVMTRTFDTRASRIAATCLSANARPVFLFDPEQRFLGVDIGPGQRTVGQTQYPVGNDLPGPVQPAEKDAGCLANRVRDSRAKPLAAPNMIFRKDTRCRCASLSSGHCPTTLAMQRRLPAGQSLLAQNHATRRGVCPRPLSELACAPP